jgi:hypothetical protein
MTVALERRCERCREILPQLESVGAVPGNFNPGALGEASGEAQTMSSGDAYI